jgi:hypothetical protein
MRSSTAQSRLGMVVMGIYRSKVCLIDVYLLKSRYFCTSTPKKEGFKIHVEMP